MRSFIGIFFIVLFFSACVGNKSVQVSGRIETNNSRDSVVCFHVNGEMHEFSLDNNHYFSGKIELDKGTYAIVSRPYYMTVFLTPGEDLEINIVNNSSTPQFKGTLSAINNYLKDQARYLTSFRASVYETDEQEFVKQMTDAINMNILLLEAKNLGDEFTNLERERIRYRVAEWAIQYPGRHAALDSANYQPGPVFDEFISTFDINNEELLAFPNYRQFLLTYFYSYKGKNMTTRRLIDHILSHVTNSKVRDYLLTEVVYAHFSQYGLRDSDYLLSICWNEVYDTSKMVRIKHMVDRWRRLSSGATAPDIQLISEEGKETQLKDAQGNYLYICVWLPMFGGMGEQDQKAWGELVREYDGKNIRFITLFPGDNSAFPRLRNIPGEHFLLKDVSEFYSNYMINSLPRYMLISPDGRILAADAPKPSGSVKLLFQNMGL